MTVEFIDVGRDKRSWTETIEGKDLYFEIERVVRRSGAIMSRGIDVEIEEDGTGKIIVGGFRTVGTFKIRDYVSQN